MKDERDYRPSNNDDLFNIFDEIIKPGNVELEREVMNGWTVRVKVLDTGEAVAAEAVMRYDGAIPSDLVARVRGASILSRAIVSINGDVIEREGMDRRAIDARRSVLYTQLLKLPAVIIQKTYELYVEAYEKQQEYYKNLNKTGEEIKNF